MRARWLTVTAALAASLLCASATAASSALAASPAPHWMVNSFAAPTYFKPGDSGDRYQVIVRNDGAAPTNGSAVTIANALPAGVTATKIEGEYTAYFVGAAGNRVPLNCELSALTCSYEHGEGGQAPVVSPGDTLWLTITVSAASGAQSCSACVTTVEGGGAPPASIGDPIATSSAEAAFGFARFDTELTNASGEPDTTAGSHPYELTTSFALDIASLDQTPSEIYHGAAVAPADVKDVNVALPPGLVGNPDAVPTCSQFAFEVLKRCPSDTQVGWVTLLPYGAGIERRPNNEALESAVYNVAPPPGQPAELGFQPDNFPIRVFFHVRGDGTGDYGITAQTSDVTQFVPVQMAILTLWGVPAEASHDQERRGAEGEQQCEHAVDQKEHQEQLEAKGGEAKAKEREITAKEEQLEAAEEKKEAKKRITELEAEQGKLERELSALEAELSKLELEGFRKASGCPSGIVARPFLTLPTSCQGSPLAIEAEGDSWAQPGTFIAPSPAMIGPLVGCEALALDPTLTVAPESAQAASPSGYTVELHVPQNEEPGADATADARKVAITLPPGTVASPSAATGLQACTDDPSQPPGSPGDQFGLLPSGGHSSEPASCPPASQIGTVTVHTPLLSSPLEGALYLGQPECEPCSAADAAQGRMVRLFLQAQGSGVIVKLEGRTSLNEATGQLTSTFEDSPQLPFEDLKVVIDGGPRAPLANPSACGAFTASGVIEPWSAPFSPDATPSSAFDTTGCASPGQFAPAFTAGTVNDQAGASAPFTLSFSRVDSDQDFDTVTVTTPPGLLGMLSKVALCPEPQASIGGCPVQSLIGNTTVASGPGPDPLYLGGEVFLTGPYKGGPFGLSIVVHAHAGPFDLGNVIVRARITINPYSSAITVTSDPLPTIVDGVPTQIKTVNVLIDREGFMLNPTDCAAMRVQGVLTGTGGASAPVASSFEAANCATLPFKPKFTALTQAKTSKAGGASLRVNVTSGAGQANIAKVNVDLPVQLPSRLTTLQQACLAAVFEANPASCPAGSVVGTATVSTPVLRSELSGPAYLVSHGGAAFPDLEIVLQGEGITLILDGQTDIKKGITSSAFRSLPDAPITSFHLVLPEGPHSALTAYGRLCTGKLDMPTEITGQNGAVIKQTTKIAVSGCPRRKAKRASHASKKNARRTTAASRATSAHAIAQRRPQR